MLLAEKDEKINKSVSLFSCWNFIFCSKEFCKFLLYPKYTNVVNTNSSSEKKHLLFINLFGENLEETTHPQTRVKSI